MSNRGRKGYNHYKRPIGNQRSVKNHSRDREEGGGKARVMREVGGKRESKKRRREMSR